MKNGSLESWLYLNKWQGVVNINENRGNIEEQRGYKFKEKVSKTRKVLLRKLKIIIWRKIV